MNVCAGLVPTPSVGVFLQSRRARYSDCPVSLHLMKTVLTALPLGCEKWGDDVECWKFQVLLKVANFADENVRPLSVTNVSGIP